MPMLWSEKHDNHIYVFWRGQLIWKYWDWGYSYLFDLYGDPRWLPERAEGSPQAGEKS